MSAIRSVILPDPVKRPDHHVLRFGEVAQGLGGRQLEPVRRHRVQVDRGLGGADAPRRVMDLGAVEALVVRGIEAVAFGEEVLERPAFGLEQSAAGA
jgi:hypothetical protein